MAFLQRLKNLFSSRGKALSLYRRGMSRANNQDHQGAIEDYSAVIEMPAAPPDVKGMALYNRALVYAAHEDNPKAIDDLNRVLAMAQTPADIKTEARRKFDRINRQAAKDQRGEGPYRRK